MELFSIKKTSLSFDLLGKQLKFEFDEAFPNTGVINVLKDFYWKNAGDVSEVPHVSVKEYTLTWGQTVTNIQRIWQIVNSFTTSGTFDPYLIMYTAKPTGFNYVFPHLLKSGDVLRSVTNNWDNNADTVQKGIVDQFIGTADSLGGGIGSNLTGGLSEMAFGKNLVSNIMTGTGYEEVKKYSSTSGQKLTISFPLYNTKDVKSALKNYSLVMLLNFQNLKTRTTFATYIPPKLYSISNPYQGGVYIPVAHMSNLEIKSLGTTRVLKEYGNKQIPEAYQINITFSELISQSSNIFKGVIDGSRISVLSNDLGGMELNREGFEKAGDALIDAVFGDDSFLRPQTP